MTPRTRRLLGPVAVGVGVLAATAYLAAVDPNESGHYPLCPTKALTGLDCPGCGGLRAVHSLTHGDILGALDHNALVVLVVIPVAVLLWVRWLVREWRGAASDAAGQDEPPRPPTTPGPRLLYSLLALVVVFTVVRNMGAVPSFAWLGSATS
jgi:hypothetical protein